MQEHACRGQGYWVGPGNWTHTGRLGDECIYPLSHLTSSFTTLKTKQKKNLNIFLLVISSLNFSVLDCCRVSSRDKMCIPPCPVLSGLLFASHMLWIGKQASFRTDSSQGCDCWPRKRKGCDWNYTWEEPCPILQLLLLFYIQQRT